MKSNQLDPEKLRKLLRLAFCPTAQSGEVVNAVRAVAALLGKHEGDPIEELSRCLGAAAPETSEETAASDKPEYFDSAVSTQMPFGKYKGLPILEMVKKDPAYARWVLKKVKDEWTRYGIECALWAE